jgi:hypothetical protein
LQLTKSNLNAQLLEETIPSTTNPNPPKHQPAGAMSQQQHPATLSINQMPIKINFQEKFEPNMSKVPITQQRT